MVRKARPWGYEELAHIPWMVRHPDGHGAGERCSSFVQPPDLMPTILDAVGVPTTLVLPYQAPVRHRFPQDIVVRSHDVTLHGKSLLPLLRGETDSIRDFTVTAHHGAEWTIRTDQWTYMLPLRDGRHPQLYNRQEDRAEQENVIDERRDVADALELTLRRFAEKTSQC